MLAGVSLREFAERIHYSPGHLSKVETAKKPPSIELARLCDAALDAGGELTALLTHRSQATPNPESGGGRWMMSLDPEAGSWFTPIGRRELLTAAGLSPLGGFVIAPPSGLADPHALTLIGTFRAGFDEFRRLGQQASPGALLPILIAKTHVLRSLHSVVSASVRPGLLTLAARYAEYTGWMAQESGDDRAALWWTDKAVELATAGGDPSMGSYALVRRALVALYRDDPDQTIDLARRAQVGSTPARIRGLAALREGQGLALAGDYSSCRRALDRAADLLARGKAHESAEPVLGPSAVVDPVAMASGWCMYDLGRPREAAEILDREIKHVPPEAVRASLRWGARRALAHAAQGEIEYAAALARGLLPGLTQITSATVRLDVRKLSRTLARWGTHPSVRELLPDLNVALRTSTTMR